MLSVYTGLCVFLNIILLYSDLWSMKLLYGMNEAIEVKGKMNKNEKRVVLW